jgi:hypothetical protein
MKRFRREFSLEADGLLTTAYFKVRDEAYGVTHAAAWKRCAPLGGDRIKLVGEAFSTGRKEVNVAA